MITMDAMTGLLKRKEARSIFKLCWRLNRKSRELCQLPFLQETLEWPTRDNLKSNWWGSTKSARRAEEILVLKLWARVGKLPDPDCLRTQINLQTRRSTLTTKTGLVSELTNLRTSLMREHNLWKEALPGNTKEIPLKPLRLELL